MNKVYLAIIAILISVNICAGQNANARGEKQVVLASGTKINAELQKTLDVNKTKVGDEVVFKTSQSIKQNGEVAIPRGSRLIGRVTDVQRRAKEHPMSTISMVFERIQGRELSVPLNATIVSITNAAANTSIGDSMATDVSGSSQTSGTASGGGLLGGVGGAVGGVVNTATQTVGAVSNAVVQTAGATGQAVGRTVNGLQISAAASGSASSSTTLSTPNKNLRVDKGASFQLLVAN